jgi:hypothetical protein
MVLMLAFSKRILPAVGKVNKAIFIFMLGVNCAHTCTEKDWKHRQFNLFYLGPLPTLLPGPFSSRQGIEKVKS